MGWRGKAIGFLLGLLTRRPQFMVLGLLLGHLYDIGLFSNRPRVDSAPPAADGLDAAYASLGLKADASDTDLEQAYRRRMSEYHPDRVANAASEIRALAETRAREINIAYDAIRRARQRDA